MCKSINLTDGKKNKMLRRTEPKGIFMNSVLKRVQKINLSRFMMMHNKRTE